MTLRTGFALQLNCVVIESRLLVISSDVIVLVKLPRLIHDRDRGRATGRAAHSITAYVETRANGLTRQTGGVDSDARCALPTDDPARGNGPIVARRYAG